MSKKTQIAIQANNAQKYDTRRYATMPIGGYTILNFSGYNFTSGIAVAAGTSKQLDKLHDVVEGSMKPMLVQNLTVAGTDYPSYFTAFGVANTKFTSVQSVNGKTITIAIATSGITVTVA